MEFPIVRAHWGRVAASSEAASLTGKLGAKRAVLPGMGHNPQLLGQPFNDVLRDFLRHADR